MTSYSLAQIAEIVSGELKGNPELTVTDISFDTRKLVSPRNSIFIALKTARNDGHNYIAESFRKGVRAFLVQKDYRQEIDASFISVEDPLLALQRLAQYHRSQFQIPVLAITGSNGKTIVKEWLSQLLTAYMPVAASPRSYNSQLGVPLSIWQVNSAHEIALIEAGISQSGEMEKLEAMIQPSLGIFTNIGDAHLENFTDKKTLIREKAQLFRHADKVIVKGGHTDILKELKELNLPTHSWGTSTEDTVHLTTEIKAGHTVVEVNRSIRFIIPFTDAASIENACNVLITALLLEVPYPIIQRGLKSLESLDMRLQVLKGVNGCTIINDSYTADVKALENSLDLAHNYAYKKPKTLIISKFPQAHLESYAHIKRLIIDKDVTRLITIGLDTHSAQDLMPNVEPYLSKEAFLNQDLLTMFRDEVIIIKGARKFQLEDIAKRLQQKDQQTVLEINLNAFTENLNYYRSLIAPKTKIMAMVKAFSYGSGSYEVASHLESLGVEYLAVAQTDEGAELRKNGVQVPILVLNPEPSAFSAIVRYELQPEIYSLALLKEFISYIEENRLEDYPIQIKLDTGMHRLGMEEEDLDELIETISSSKAVKIEAIFSHLAAADNPKEDEFTRGQIATYDKYASQIMAALDYSPLRHICNSAAISRFPEAHNDMVRLGISLYGISSNEEVQKHIKLASRLKTTIIQTRILKPGDTLGYGRRFTAKARTEVAVIPIGYADGLFRGLGNGKFHAKIGKQTAKIIGTICMDMCFLDITHWNAKTGDEVQIFSTAEDVKEMANIINSIPYEILSAISYRVKREYYAE